MNQKFCDPWLYTVNHPKMIVSNQMEESMSIQHVIQLLKKPYWQAHDILVLITLSKDEGFSKPAQMCLHTQNMDVIENSGKNLDLWPCWNTSRTGLYILFELSILADSLYECLALFSL